MSHLPLLAPNGTGMWFDPDPELVIARTEFRNRTGIVIVEWDSTLCPRRIRGEGQCRHPRPCPCAANLGIEFDHARYARSPRGRRLGLIAEYVFSDDYQARLTRWCEVHALRWQRLPITYHYVDTVAVAVMRANAPELTIDGPPQ